MLAYGLVDRGSSNESLTRALLISDVSQTDSLRISLERSPLDVSYSPPGAQAIAAAVEVRPELLLVDCRSDEATALRLCASLREVREIAPALLIVITREGREDLRIQASEAGADDCFGEPRTSRELCSRLDALKHGRKPEAAEKILKYADLELDIRAHKVRRDGSLIWLSALQLRLLKFLMENPAVVFTRQELLQAVWQDASLDEGAVTVGVVRLRRALNSTGGTNLIRQVRGFGYALDADLDK